MIINECLLLIYVQFFLEKIEFYKIILDRLTTSSKSMENIKFNNQFEYECCLGIKCKGFTELMFMAKNANKITNCKTKIMMRIADLIFEKPLELKKYINSVNKLGWTALMLACRNSNTTSNDDIVESLLISSVDIYKENNNKDTALSLALFYAGTDSNIQTVKLLLDKWNANNLAENYEHYFAVAWKNKLHNVELLKMLINVCAGTHYKREIFTNIVKNSRTKRNSIILKILSEYMTDIDYTCSNNYTPLMLACRYSSSTSDNATVKLLLEKGANPDYKQKNEYLPIILASSYSTTTSNIDTVKLLLEYDADINIRDVYRNTALIMAIKNSRTSSNFETVKFLLDNGANVHYVNKYLDSPLHMAIEKYVSDSAIIELLLEHKANINLKNEQGESCLFLFIMSNPLTRHYEKYKEIIKLFLDCDADINSLTKYNRTPQSLMLDYYIKQKGQNEKVNEILNLFLETKINYNNYYNYNNYGLLQLASHSHEFNMTDIVVKLVKYGADVNLINSEGESALLIAARTGKCENLYFISLLLSLGANVNIQDSRDTTCLKYAIKFRNLEMIELLLEHGADTNLIDCIRNNILSYIFSNGRIQNENDLKIIKLLVKYGAKVNFDNGVNSILNKALDIESYIGPRIVEFLLDNGADPNYYGNNNYNGLHYLIKKNNIFNDNILTNINLLLKHDANPNLLDSNGNNSVLLAIKTCCPFKLINVLIDNGGNIHVINKKNKTALIYAVKLTNINIDYCLELVNLLLDNKINAQLRDSRGQTALIKAVNKILYNKTFHNELFGTNGIFTRLSEHTSFDTMDNNGKTVMAYIHDEYMVDFIKLFKKKCVQDYLTKTIHNEIIESNLEFLMKPNSIRTRIATIQWYSDRGETYQELIKRDAQLFDYFGINDIDDLHLKIGLTSKYVN
ncbi:putative ankyrin repeat protein [Cotonvirus japonicus]|uniref:Ankyrin repeat protein n=1 Tax=Cotonvirus japonicus TaxID=2811091 RepID=A0ABM7NTW3_9VIRU|nr:putative ankyrin repeat protein [Cotonvirus japonicus]BCS83604.1 putative ankyrin repeat protein [Cotonvirus japonicus]